METIGFIGTGVMGVSMAGHLHAAGHPIVVFNRTKARARSLLDKGALWAETPGAVAAASDVVITIVGFPEDVRSVYLGEDGVLAKARSGALLIDMTTSSPMLAREIADAAMEKGLFALDAPVSGGDVGAREARLSIMVGGARASFERALPIFERMGKSIVYQGGAGAGQHTKMVNQIIIASSMVAISEAMAYAKQSGLDPETVLECISGGAAGSWALSNLAPRMLKRDFAPGFYVKHFIKDMRIAIESAEEMGLDLPGLKLAKSLYDRLSNAGGGDDGTQALLRIYERGL